MLRASALICALLLVAGCSTAGAGTPGDTDPGWPATLTKPASPPPLLPTDRAVGRAQLLYSCPHCHWYLQQSDGTRYTLPAGADKVVSREDGTTAGGVLSPDGRWLAMTPLSARPDSGGWADPADYRDLLGATVRHFGRAEAWSANDRWVVAMNDQFSHVRLDLESGTVTPLNTRSKVRGVLDDGEVVLVSAHPYPYEVPSVGPHSSSSPGVQAGGVEVTVVDPSTGRQRTFSPDTSQVPTGTEQQSETIGWSGWTVRADGSEFAAALGTAVARFSLRDGQLLSHLTMPAQTFLYAYDGSGSLLAVRYGATGATDLERLDHGTILCAVPAGIQVSFRGAWQAL